VPVLLVHGAADRSTPPRIGLAMAALIPDAQFLVIEGAGHLANVEKPAEFNAALRAFLAVHRRRALRAQRQG
jgi:3-oxoadipate enol-lactonase